MKIDYHVHLEEGPYSFGWLDRTAKAINSFRQSEDLDKNSKEYMKWQVDALKNRLDKGCFSQEWLDLYLQKAKQLGLKEVGIVDHLYRFKETKNYFEKNMLLDENDPIGKLQSDWLGKVMTENMNDFTNFIVQEKKRWSEQGVELKLGIEADYFVGCERELAELLQNQPWDYVIGSIHFVDGWGFDNPQTANKFEEVDLKVLYERFFETVEQAIRSGMFDFVAHLDNLKVFGYKVEDEAFNQMWYERIASALVETNTATEVNAGLFYRYPVKEMCPGPAFLKTLVAKGVEFTVSSDSHFPDDLGKYTLVNTESLKSLGVERLIGFDKRERTYHSI
ncbi:histidinol phosphate phosphatase domain-containing protein [Psychrobacillus sp.]|uniref:histidinol phosphate phosphatase domain-containing protein n=1 Tax=Psychrobacillus sp. TaxID=1871623 RepID=UPI0028BF0E98|nr:histidinol phosphate phosphatase domain-containing protein [Psychrobacillus sp.]